MRRDLRSAHPLVIKTRDAFSAAWKDERGILHPDSRREHSGALAIHVSKNSINRALRIADSLLKAIEANGWQVRCPAKTEQRGTGIVALGEEVAISLEEKVRRFERPKESRLVTKGHRYDLGRGPYINILVDPYPRFGYEQLGLLALRVPGYGSPRLQVADGTTKRLEEHLDEFLVGVVRIAEEYRERRKERDERERQRLEEVRARQELERIRAEEAALLARLEQDATLWRKAMDIRGYIAAARAAEPNADEVRLRYFAWALTQADRMDPTIA